MVLSSTRRREHIAQVVCENRPQILLCAGYSVDTKADLEWLANQNLETFIFAEASIKKGQDEYFLIDGNEINTLGKQNFSTRDCLRKNPQLAEQLSTSRTQIPLLCKNVYLLICGEINIIRAGKQITILSDIANKYIANSEIILNPTHDWMNNRGGWLSQKRQYLSQKIRNRNRVYLSSSNWHTNKPKQNGTGFIDQSQSPTLHTVYRNGEYLDFDQIISEEAFEYRQITLELWPSLNRPANQQPRRHHHRAQYQP